MPNLRNLSINLILISIFLKIGIPPFHLWIPVISPYISWLILLLILTIQKLIPFYIINLINATRNFLLTSFLIVAVILTSIIPPFIIIKLTNFKIIITYSSINQSGWLILITIIKSNLWLIYFIFYTLIIIIISSLIYIYKINFMFINNDQSYISLISIFYIFNIGGLPPFSIFYIKWEGLFISIWNRNIFFLIIILIIRSLVILYIYINIILISLFFYKQANKLNITINIGFSCCTFWFLLLIIILLFMSAWLIFN